MKRCYLAIFSAIFICLLSGLVTATCVNSDTGAEEIYVYGYAKSDNVQTSDYCSAVSVNLLYESYCNSAGVADHKQVSCKYGCKSGACVTVICAPKTCSSLGYNCGTASNGCGGTLNCGTCPTGLTCTANKCVSTCANEGEFIYASGKKCCNGLVTQDPCFGDTTGTCVAYSWKCAKPAVCGDGVCEYGEDSSNCANDCGTAIDCSSSLTGDKCKMAGGNLVCVTSCVDTTTGTSGGGCTTKCYCECLACISIGQTCQPMTGTCSSASGTGCITTTPPSVNPQSSPGTQTPTATPGNTGISTASQCCSGSSCMQSPTTGAWTCQATNCAKEGEVFMDSGRKCCEGLERVVIKAPCAAGQACAAVVMYTCKKSTTTCAKEGESVPVVPGAKECCAGLSKISLGSSTGDCSLSLHGSSVCTYCGDGICGTGENKCNCPQDCPENCVIGIRTDTCCSCPQGISRSQVGTAGWVVYELGRDYSSFPKAENCQGVACSPCQSPYQTSCSLCGNGKCETGETPNNCPTDCPTTKCAKEGEYTPGAVAPEYYYGCCSGLVGFNPWPRDWVGGGNLCYDPTKGVPVCKAQGSKSEGWYYPNGTLLRYQNCSQVSCAKENEIFQDAGKKCCSGLVKSTIQVPCDCASGTDCTCPNVMSYTCKKPTETCKQEGQSCCTGTGCAKISVECNAGYQYVFKGCDQSCSPLWSCLLGAVTGQNGSQNGTLVTRSIAACSSCQGGTLCGDKNSQGLECTCVDVNSDGGNEVCKLSKVGKGGSQSSYTLSEFISRLLSWLK